MKRKFYTISSFLLISFFCFAFTARATNYMFSGVLSGAAEVPPNASPGTGLIVGFYDDATNTLTYAFGFKDLLANTTAGHFHAPAPSGVTAGVVIPFAGMPLGVTKGVYRNSHVLTDAQETQLMAGLWYANIHTTAVPSGELRAQIELKPLSMGTYPFISNYSGTQEVPPNNSPAKGIILGTYDINTNTLNYGLGFLDLTGNTVASHFHAPAPMGVNAGVVIAKPSFPTGVREGIYFNTHTLTQAQEVQLLSGLWYSNIHTTVFPGGEIRAQIFPTAPPTFLNNGSIVLNTSCANNDGSISIIPQTGVAPFMYSINGGATYVAGPAAGYTFNNLSTGTYQLRLKDANGNESEIVTRKVMQEFGGPTFLNNSSIVLDASCKGNDGNISIIPTCGNAPYQYSINGGATYVSGPDLGYTFMGLAAGTYQLRLKDAMGRESAVVTKMVKANAFGPCASVAPLGSQLRTTVGREAMQVKTFPNPSRGNFRVQLNNMASSHTDVMIFDAKGAMVQRRQIIGMEGSTVDFDLSRSNPGLYFIRVTSEKGSYQTKVLVQR